MTKPSVSILTFTLSVVDRKNISTIDEPFQLMPATRNYLQNTDIDKYFEQHNENILLHMNYITQVYSDKAIESNSMPRHSLRQYVKLAAKLGTKDILLHGPATMSEWNYKEYGFNLIKDEIIDKGYILQLELPSWDKSLINYFKDDISKYIDELLLLVKDYEDKVQLVFDTAHMHADGCEDIETFKNILFKYEKHIKYIHMNGNFNYKYTKDKHVPMFDERNKITCWEELSLICSDLNVICVAEVTSESAEWKDWVKFANDYNFVLVKYNKKYTC